MAYSKATDGLNSPINLLNANIAIPLEPVQYDNQKATTQILSKIAVTNAIKVARNADGEITSIKSSDNSINYANSPFIRGMNAFSINTIIDMVDAADTLEEFGEAVKN